MSVPRGLSLLVKPAGADCNLRCDYCFYLETESSYDRPGPHRMGGDVLEAMLAAYLALPVPVHSLCWQGGEPTLLGPGFYRQATRLQERLARPGAVIANSVQTNLTLIDDELAALFARYRFLVGCSIDGPARLHDRHRRGRGGAPSHARALAGLETLLRHGVETNALVLVSTANAEHAGEVYDHLVGLGFRYLQFIPCLEFGTDGRPRSCTITAARWGEFLCALYDRWRTDGPGRISVRLFDALMARLALDQDLLCTFAGDCRHYLVVEHDGNVYPCDFLVRPERRLGNVLEDSLADIVSGGSYRRFGAVKTDLPAACRSCPHLSLCRGDCPLHRAPGAAGDQDGSWLCAGWRRFFEYAGPGLADLARREMALRRRGA